MKNKHKTRCGEGKELAKLVNDPMAFAAAIGANFLKAARGEKNKGRLADDSEAREVAACATILAYAAAVRAPDPAVISPHDSLRKAINGCRDASGEWSLEPAASRFNYADRHRKVIFKSDWRKSRLGCTNEIECWTAPEIPQELRDFIGSLSTLRRNIVLAAVTARNAREIASRLGISHDAVRQHLVAIRKAARSCGLKPHMYERTPPPLARPVRDFHPQDEDAWIAAQYARGAAGLTLSQIW